MDQDFEPYANMDEEIVAELFASALARIEAGEDPQFVLSDVPEQNRAELSSLLGISNYIRQAAQEPVPPMNQARSRAARVAFLDQAAALRAELQQTQVSAQPLWREPTAAPETGWLVQLQRQWTQLVQQLQALLTVRSVRLAPIALTLALSAILASGLVTITRAAVPGEPSFAFQKWVWRMEQSLAAQNQVALIEARQQEELRQEIEEAAAIAKVQATASGDLNLAVRRETLTVRYTGLAGNLLNFDSLLVLRSYQPDANLRATIPITIIGDLKEGALVEVTVNILPGQGDSVQGISARVLEPTAPPSSPSVQPEKPSVVTAPCEPRPIAGWVRYVVNPGDTVSDLAQQRGATTVTIAELNCLPTDNTIVVGQSIFVPAVTTTATDSELPTAIPTIEPPPTAAPDQLETTEPTLEATPDVTAEATEEATEEATVLPGDGSTDSEATPEATTDAEVSPTAETTATLEPTPEPTSTVSDEATPTASATPTPTDQPTTVVTSTATAGGGVIADATATIEAPTGVTTTTPEAPPTLESVAPTPTAESPPATPTPTVEALTSSGNPTTGDANSTAEAPQTATPLPVSTDAPTPAATTASDSGAATGAGENNPASAPTPDGATDAQNTTDPSAAPISPPASEPAAPASNPPAESNQPPQSAPTSEPAAIPPTPVTPGG